MKKEKIMEVKNISKSFSIKKGFFSRKSDSLRAVNDVSFSLYEGETLAIVGESGCGKSTVRKLILNLLDADSGEVYYKDKNILSLNKKDMRLLRKEIQVIFQDPYSSLNPKWRIGKIIEEPLVTHRIGTAEERKARVKELLEHVGINPNFYGRYPHEFSGGQRQRIGIARALALEPEIIVADEPVSALDVSIQAQVLNMFKKLQKEFGLTYIFISHDLSVVKHISDRVAVMYLGEIVEVAKTKELYDNPKHPYTKALMASIPLPDPNMEQGVIHLKGEIPSPINPPSGCTFHPRCPMAMDVCKVNEPKETLFSNNRKVKCHLYGEEYINEKKESS